MESSYTSDKRDRDLEIMPQVFHTNSLPGTIVDCFPLTSPLTDWLTAKVRLTESSPGLWTGTLAAGNWAVFEGGSQPANFSLSIGILSVEATPAPPTPPAPRPVTPAPTAPVLNVNSQTILNNALGPQSVSSDGLTVTARSTKDQLDALAAVTANAAGRKRRRGLLMTRIVPGSAVGETR